MERIIRIIAVALLLCFACVALGEGDIAEDIAVAEPSAEAFLDTWVCDEGSVEIYEEDQGYAASVLVNGTETEDDRWTYLNCVYDEEANAVVCAGEGFKTHFIFGTEDAEAISEVVLSELSATFTIDENDHLIWSDDQENAGEGLVFERLAVSEENDTSWLRPLRLGSSKYAVAVKESFQSGMLTEDDIGDDQVGYYFSEESQLDFDIYQFDKEGIPDDLNSYVLDEASGYESVIELRAEDELNGIPVAWYRTTEEYDGTEYETVTYILDDDDEFVEIVFWLDGDDARAEAKEIIDTLTTLETREQRLGTSNLFITILDSYGEGELSEEDIAEGQVAYYVSEATPVDFDVYQLAGDDMTLAQFVFEHASGYSNVSEIVADREINEIPVAWYRTTEEYEGVEYDTITCFAEDGDGFVEIVFWLDGETAEAEVNAIIGSLKHVEPRTIALGDSAFTLTVPADYQEGGLAEGDAEQGQVSYWYSDESLLDFDVYVLEAEDVENALPDALADTAESVDGMVSFDDDETINGIPVIVYRTVEEYEESEYNTITYMMEDGSRFVKVTFWLDGSMAEEEADAIIQTLAMNDTETEGAIE